MSIPKIAVSPAEWAIIRDALQSHVSDREVWAFGSRVKWTNKEFSDLDIAIIGDEPLSISTLASLADAFSESVLPYKVDIADWATTSPSFRSVIKKDKVVIQLSNASAWRYVRLGDHCDKIGSGATPKGGKEAYLKTGPYRLIRSQNIYNDGFKYEGLAFISDEQAKKLDGVAVNADDVLLNIIGDSVARVCSAPSNVLPARVNQHVAIIRPSPSSLDARFVRYYLASPQQQDLLLGLASAGATRNALTKGMIESLFVPQPPMAEQKLIADTLATLDEKIILLREANATLEAIAQALYKSWFVNFDPVRAKAEGHVPEGMDAATVSLFPDGFEDSEYGEIPKGWSYCSLKEVVAIFDSKRVPLSSSERANRRGEYPYYGAAALMDFVDDYLFDGVFLLTGEDGSVADNVGFPITQYVWGKFWVNNHAHVLQGKNGVSTEHVMLSLKRTNIQPLITGAVQAKLSQANMWRINFVRAPRAVSELFGSIISPIYESFRQNADQANSLSALRDTILPRLMSGKLGVEEIANRLEAISA